ncbi:hypothetical protein [Zavarzinella formosa]|uniref:hypothetical protein n=1 Tax=Zavarzinella formosa TaxID=360055 RepID=UPI00031080B1|nr:hypothetical protein [Zavarzinella formosa]
MTRKTTNRMTQRQVSRQRSLFGPELPSTLQMAGPDIPCNVVAIEKRRDGKMRHWCLTHRADATAKGGTPAKKCRLAHRLPLSDEDIKPLDLDQYLGGVALWGAVPAVYDTTRRPMDSGIHIHARPKPGSKKELDFTYRAVRLVGKNLPDNGIVVNEADAIYYMISSVFGFSMCFVTCTHCGWPHLDKDWFSVHPHRRHLCSGCGKHFYDSVRGIGNPIIGVQEACNADEHGIEPAARKLDIKQSEFPGGIQIWGSNPAFLWTQPKHEEEGIHVHAFLMDVQDEPEIDDTFSEVVIDGVRLDHRMVRVLMAQNVLPSLSGRVRSMECSKCGNSQFDAGEAAYVPATMHTCIDCGRQFPTRGQTKKTVANPLLAILNDLAKHSPRPPQEHQLNLMPETL